MPSDWGRKGEMSGETVAWWLGQPKEAQQRLLDLCGKGSSLPEVLLAFQRWVEHASRRLADAVADGHCTVDVLLWGNGATFDNVVLRNAFLSCGLPPFWSFRSDRCYRTMVNFLDPKGKRRPLDNEGKHDALSDAKWQSEYLFRLLEDAKKFPRNCYDEGFCDALNDIDLRNEVPELTMNRKWGVSHSRQRAEEE
jgi:hypothetical protein